MFQFSAGEYSLHWHPEVLLLALALAVCMLSCLSSFNTVKYNKMPGGCQDPGSMENGHRYLLSHICVGHRVILSCKSGYKMDGDPNVVCTRTGQFNKPIPPCVLDTSGRPALR